MNEEEKKAVERIEDTFYSDLRKGINKFQKNNTVRRWH